MEIREATIEDWKILEVFFKRIYRKNHPLHTLKFWEWQYNDINHGRSLICICNNKIVGHVGANFGGGIAWIINVYLDEEFRGKGILSKLYALARKYYPLAATAANDAGLNLYRNMRWIRYYDLVRYVKINPKMTKLSTVNVCSKVNTDTSNLIYKGTHYFNQPGLTGIKIGSLMAVDQSLVGGLRVVDFDNVYELESNVWELGYNWVDYITSWNDQKIKQLEESGWQLDKQTVVPWRLDPIIENFYCNITFLSELPLPNDFVVHRSYSDHGRVGSIIV